MVESKPQEFMNHATNRTLLFCASVMVAIVGVTPLANSYFEQLSRRVEADIIRAEVGQLEITVDQLDKYLAECKATTSELNAEMIDATQAETFRDQVVELVRTSDCRLRNLTLDERTQRRWMEGDNPLTDGGFGRFHDDESATPYLLESQRLELVVSGHFENVKTLLSRIQSLQRLFSTQSLQIHKDPTQSEITLQWELTLFSLTNSPTDDE